MQLCHGAVTAQWHFGQGVSSAELRAFLGAAQGCEFETV